MADYPYIEPGKTHPVIGPPHGQLHPGRHPLDKLSKPDYLQPVEGYAAGAPVFDREKKSIAQDVVFGGVHEVPNPETPELLSHHASQILDNISPGWREQGHMVDTPMRFAQQLLDLTTREEFKFTTFESTSDEMVVLSPIPFYTLCAHHVIPFFGQAHVGYVPDKLIAGLSKFGRLVKWAAKGLWVQEELTGFIASEIESRLAPKGVAVVLEGEHMCMAMRGVEMAGVKTTTASMRGVFGMHDRTAKAEFFETIRRNRG